MFLGKTIALIVLLLVAYQFYRGFKKSMDAFEREGSSISRVSDEFVRALFSVMGHLAKTDGRVSEDEIRAARLVMHRLGLSPAQVRRAVGWCNRGHSLYIEDDTGIRRGYDCGKVRKEHEEVRARMAGLRLYLDEGLEEECRCAGCLPGWIR